MAVMARTALSVLFFGLVYTRIASLGFSAPFEPGRPIPELHLANGTVLREVKIVSTGSTTVIATWDGGKGTILLSLLPDDLRTSLIRQAPKAPARPAPDNSSVADTPLDANGLPTWIKLNNGFMMRDCTILRWSQDAITVRFVGGTVPVRFSDIHVVQRSLFESKRAAALEQQAKDDTAMASQAARKAPEEIAAESLAKRGQATEEDIRKGVETHRLVPGMTMAQVTAVYGEPPATSNYKLGSTRNSEWTYPRGTRKPSGEETLRDVHVKFYDGILKSWDGEVEIDAKLTSDQKYEVTKTLSAQRRVPELTMDEAIKTYGTPAKKEESYVGTSVISVWTYPRDKRSPFFMARFQDVHLTFQDGILREWDDRAPPPLPQSQPEYSR